MAMDVKKAVCDGIESKAFENGIVTMQSLGEMLKLHHVPKDMWEYPLLGAIREISY
jgi:hypothetical protein